jgi:hypothetical protein
MNKFVLAIKTFLGKVFGSGTFQTVFQTAISNILALTTASAIDLLTQVALKEAGQLEGTGLSSDEKRKAVLDKLKTTAITEGVTVTTTALNLILETAVNSLKK